METITISKATALVLLDRMADWCEYVETLCEHTRRDIIALDELVRAIPNGEELLHDIEARQLEERREMMKRHEERQKAEAKAAKAAK